MRLLLRQCCRIAALLIFQVGNAWSNAAAPPANLWILWEGQGPRPTLELQLCPDSRCETTPAALTCDGEACFFSTYFGEASEQIRIRARFGNEILESPIFPANLQYGSSQVLGVSRDAATLRIAPLPQGRMPMSDWLKRWPLAFALTLLLEEAVALLGLLLLRIRRERWATVLLAVFLANLFTHPLVYLVFPIGAQWFPRDRVGLGLALGIFCLYYFAMLWIAPRWKSGRQRLRGIAFSALALIPVLILAAFAAFLGSYGKSHQVILNGVPWQGLLLGSEIFAWLAETALLYRLCKASFGLRECTILAFAMNLASFLMGAWILRA